jgi:hypothetical protein
MKKTMRTKPRPTTSRSRSIITRSDKSVRNTPAGEDSSSATDASRCHRDLTKSRKVKQDVVPVRVMPSPRPATLPRCTTRRTTHCLSRFKICALMAQVLLRTVQGRRIILRPVWVRNRRFRPTLVHQFSLRVLSRWAINQWRPPLCHQLVHPCVLANRSNLIKRSSPGARLGLSRCRLHQSRLSWRLGC